MCVPSLDVEAVLLFFVDCWLIVLSDEFCCGLSWRLV